MSADCIPIQARDASSSHVHKSCMPGLYIHSTYNSFRYRYSSFQILTLSEYSLMLE